MSIYKTTMLTAAALTLASGAAFAGAHGSYPSKPVKIVVGFLPAAALTQHHAALHHICTKPRAWVASRPTS